MSRIAVSTLISVAMLRDDRGGVVSLLLPHLTFHPLPVAVWALRRKLGAPAPPPGGGMPQWVFPWPWALSSGGEAPTDELRAATAQRSDRRGPAAAVAREAGPAAAVAEVAPGAAVAPGAGPAAAVAETADGAESAAEESDYGPDETNSVVTRDTQAGDGDFGDLQDPVGGADAGAAVAGAAGPAEEVLETRCGRVAVQEARAAESARRLGVSAPAFAWPKVLVEPRTGARYDPRLTERQAAFQ